MNAQQSELHVSLAFWQSERGLDLSGPGRSGVPLCIGTPVSHTLMMRRSSSKFSRRVNEKGQG